MLLTEKDDVSLSQYITLTCGHLISFNLCIISHPRLVGGFGVKIIGTAHQKSFLIPLSDSVTEQIITSGFTAERKTYMKHTQIRRHEIMRK